MYMENGTDYESIIVTHGNGLFNYTQFTTVYATAISTKMCTSTMTAQFQAFPLTPAVRC